MIALWVALAVLAALSVGLRLARRLPSRARRALAVIADPADGTTLDSRGAVRSVQAADLYLPAEQLEQLWSPMYLERLARTYWRFLTRVTLGLIRVHYTERERFVVLLAKPFKLLTFQAPEYWMDAERGIVRWRIERGLLVARAGRGRGYLQIDICRHPADESGRARLHAEVEVAYFYPAIASGISRRVYNATQSRIHVIVTHAFLRSLARLDLAESRVARWPEALRPEDVPDPPPLGVPAPPGAAAKERLAGAAGRRG